MDASRAKPAFTPPRAARDRVHRGRPGPSHITGHFAGDTGRRARSPSRRHEPGDLRRPDHGHRPPPPRSHAWGDNRRRHVATAVATGVALVVPLSVARAMCLTPAACLHGGHPAGPISPLGARPAAGSRARCQAGVGVPGERVARQWLRLFSAARRAAGAPCSGAPGDARRPTARRPRVRLGLAARCASGRRLPHGRDGHLAAWRGAANGSGEGGPRAASPPAAGGSERGASGAVPAGGHEKHREGCASGRPERSAPPAAIPQPGFSRDAHLKMASRVS